MDICVLIENLNIQKCTKYPNKVLIVILLERNLEGHFLFGLYFFSYIHKTVNLHKHMRNLIILVHIKMYILYIKIH